MCHTQISLDPEADARLSAMFDAAVAAEKAKPDDGRTFEQLKANAVMAMMTAAPVAGARRPAELPVLVDLQTLRNGLHQGGVCETYDGQPLPPATVRRLACEADIIPIVLGGDGRIVDVGRPDAWPPPTNDEHCERCTRPAPLPTARCASVTATSAASPSGETAA